MSSASLNRLQAEYGLVISVVLAPTVENFGMWTDSVTRCLPTSAASRDHGDLDNGGPRAWHTAGTSGPGRKEEDQEDNADAGLQRAWLLDRQQKEGRGDR